MAQGFAGQSGGVLHFTSAPGAGTTVALYIAVAGNVGLTADQAENGQSAEVMVRNARILSVDDDPMVRDVLRRKSNESLDDVLSSAAGTALKEFVVNLRRDLSAVQAALDLPWTTSPAEGQISRLQSFPRTRPAPHMTSKQHASCGRTNIHCPASQALDVKQKRTG